MMRSFDSAESSASYDTLCGQMHVVYLYSRHAFTPKNVFPVQKLILRLTPFPLELIPMKGVGRDSRSLPTGTFGATDDRIRKSRTS